MGNRDIVPNWDAKEHSTLDLWSQGQLDSNCHRKSFIYEIR